MTIDDMALAGPTREVTVADLLMDPGVSFALKAVILTWEGRDVVDAAMDARLLAEVFTRRADEAVSWSR